MRNHKKKKLVGNASMLARGHKKIEVWLTAAQQARFYQLANELGIRPATLARRCLNYASAGGKAAAFPLTQYMYD